MTSADDRLKALFAEDRPAARDPAFQAGVLAAVARRRFLGEVGWLVLATSVGGVVLATVGPVLSPLLEPVIAPWLPAALALAVAAWAVSSTADRAFRVLS
jgi:hypothetical protein